MNFADLGLIPELLKAVADTGYTEPTPIQAQAIPIILQGKDVMGGAQTGTGKTAGFTLPLLQRLARHANSSPSPARHPVRALILTPTRELAMQVEDTVKTYSKHLPLRSTCIYGGVDIKAADRRTARGPSRSSSPRRAGCSTTSSRRPSISTRSKCWCSTKPTACSTWASSRTSSASSPCCPRSARACCSRRPSRKKSRSSPTRCCATRN